MPGRFVLAVVGATACATALAAQGQRIRSGVELVSLNVTVTEGGGGRYLTDLTEEEFEVYEDGAKQKLPSFRAAQPLSLALLLRHQAIMKSA